MRPLGQHLQRWFTSIRLRTPARTAKDLVGGKSIVISLLSNAYSFMLCSSGSYTSHKSSRRHEYRERDRRTPGHAAQESGIPVEPLPVGPSP